jgi:hypothetical protein
MSAQMHESSPIDLGEDDIELIPNEHAIVDERISPDTDNPFNVEDHLPVYTCERKNNLHITI